MENRAAASHREHIAAARPPDAQQVRRGTADLWRPGDAIEVEDGAADADDEHVGGTRAPHARRRAARPDRDDR